ncbi:hypothetical protein TTRE_0000232901 [Trichuris trichiura]|uniref:DUF5648 domain-containing protein n=1 Tax=Trichuris trichiura TaxID=36087 RepID=A0A077Z5U6_TRITR|nr:hypothetical protein TTRE_0000232901 [Trichuris trichiura]
MNTNYYGPIGEIALQTNRDCALAKPVYRMYAESLNSEFLTINTTVRQQAIKLGYKDLGIIGSAVARKNDCEATIPLYAFVKKTGEIIQLEEGQDSMAMQADYMYNPNGISFWMWDEKDRDD